MADVSTPIDEYKAAATRWKLIDDATAGQWAVKAAGETYLPRPNSHDKSQPNKDRYDSYKQRAVYYNASGRTLGSFVGLAFLKFPEVETPAALDPVVKNLDGAGSTLVQHMHDTLSQVLKNGRAGLLADFPKTEGNTSRAEEQTKGIRPTVSYYPATSIINWRTVVVGSEARLSLVVLAETHREYDGFGQKCEPQYRSLQLLNGIYIVQIWRKRKNQISQKDEWEAVETFSPVGGNGQKLDFIPFTFVGSENNGVAINRAPLEDIATLNIAHYCNSADYEDSAYFCGQPQVWMAGLDESWVEMLEKKGIYFGSRAILPLPVNGSAGMMQAEPNTLAKEAMDTKEKQMAALGAQLIQAGEVTKTATEQRSDDASAHSVLSLCCDNVSAAYTVALEWAAMFGGAPGKIVVSIPTEFTKFTIDAPELTVLMDGVQRGLIPASDFWSRCRMAGVIDSKKTDDDIREEISTQDPAGGSMLDDDPDPTKPRPGAEPGDNRP